jgi:hypothetical protein
MKLHNEDNEKRKSGKPYQVFGQGSRMRAIKMREGKILNLRRMLP